MSLEAVAARFYDRAPVFLQNAICSFYGFRERRRRFNEDFDRQLDRLLVSDKWTRAEVDAYQDEQIAELVSFAYEFVPYYRDLMDERRLKPADIRSRADLVKLPILTKADVRSHSDRLIADRASRSSLVERHTSGTTGSSLHFLIDRSAVPFQWAVWWRHRLRFDFQPGDWHLNFTGKRAVPTEQSVPPYWRVNLPMRQVVMSMQHITPAKIDPIIDYIEERGLRIFTGYPSIIHSLALAATDAGRSLARPPKLIVTGAESVLERQRADLLSFTGATLTDEYGLSEPCGNASHCERFVYHEDSEFGVLECVEPEYLPDGAMKGRIIGTGFASRSFPFIRYATGDVGVWSPPHYQCVCGRASRTLVRIEGREDDYVVTPEGARIMRFDYVFKDTPTVRECQVAQEQPDEIILRIVRTAAYSSHDEAFISQQVAEWISPSLRVRYEYVDELERNATGKFRAVVSSLGS